jgi:hypothetical protein
MLINAFKVIASHLGNLNSAEPGFASYFLCFKATGACVVRVHPVD